MTLDPADAAVGQLVPDTAFTDLDGKAGRLSDYRQSKALVICMASTGCPVARKYLPRIAELHKHYGPKGVSFLLLNSGEGESAPEMRKSISNISLRYIPDSTGRLRSILGAKSTAEVFVLDASRTLAYRGAIDDQFGIGYTLPEPKARFLADALDALLAGKVPPIRATSAPGCLLETRPSLPKPAGVTFHNRISRILQDHCQECHRAGESAPFPLIDYKDAKGRVRTIQRVVQRRVMPPWFAEAPHGTFANDRRLADKDRDDLLAWIAAGAPEGNVADAPLARKWDSTWQIGKPDQVFTSPRSFTIPATGAMPYQVIAIPTHLAEDKWVQAVEIRPSEPQVVHHLLAFVLYPPDHPQARNRPHYRNGLGGYFAGLVPGQSWTVYPEGTGKLLPRGATIVLQIHYTPNGTSVQDRPAIAFKYAPKPPEHEILTLAASNTRFAIPPGDPDYSVAATYTFKGPTRLISFNPHSHVRGKAYRYELVYPDGKTQTVLDLPRYDFNWQLEYILRKPLDVPAGTRLKVTAWYDNSKENPANPDPTKTVRFGEQTWDEMMIGYFSGYSLGR